MTFSNHAKLRMQERNIDWLQVELAVQYGRQIPAKGNRTAYVVGQAEILRHRRQIDLSDLNGIVAILAPDNCVITCLWNPRFGKHT